MKKIKWKVFLICVCIVALVCGIVILDRSICETENPCHYKQQLFFNEKLSSLEGRQIVSFYNYTDNVLEKVCLHLYPNAFREGAKASVVSLANYEKAYLNGKSYGNIQIESVSDGENYLEYSVCGEDENILEICIGNELYPGDTFEFEVGFVVNLANINHRLGYGKNTINLCNYYPILCVYENIFNVFHKV